MKKEKKNHNIITFGLGTIGRDMVYSLVSMYFIFYLTDIVRMPAAPLAAIIAITVACRVFDALNDPVMGLIVDNTNTRYGRFKPWIALGAALSGVVTLVMFGNFPFSDWGSVAFFGLIYLAWGVCYTINDISYWSMLPSLSIDKSEREKIGSVARIFANVGLFFSVAGIIPITSAFAGSFGGERNGWFMFALLVTVIMWAGQLITLIGVRQPENFSGKKNATPLRELFSIVFKNDQLSCTALAMGLFMIGYTTSATFGIYYFKYVYGDQDMYSIFAVILGVSQLAALSAFPFLAARFRREKIFGAAIILITAGYVLFFFAPVTTMLFIGAAGILIFLGQGFIQVLMLLFLTDSVDYGHWKFKKRNDSITFSVQPFIYKIGGAAATGVVGAIAILSGARAAETSGDTVLNPGGLFLLKAGMLLFPLVCIAASYIIYRMKYKITAEKHSKIINDLRQWGEIAEE
jgi:melibiose permease/lactose/raffinose/galactose permease